MEIAQRFPRRGGAFSASMAPAASRALVTWAPKRTGPQAIALAGHLHNGCEREKAVENGRGRRHVTEKRAPILRRAIRGDQRRARFMSPHEDLERIFSRARAVSPAPCKAIATTGLAPATRD